MEDPDIEYEWLRTDVILWLVDAINIGLLIDPNIEYYWLKEHGVEPVDENQDVSGPMVHHGFSG